MSRKYKAGSKINRNNITTTMQDENCVKIYINTKLSVEDILLVFCKNLILLCSIEIFNKFKIYAQENIVICNTYSSRDKNWKYSKTQDSQYRPIQHFSSIDLYSKPAQRIDT